MVKLIFNSLKDYLILEKKKKKNSITKYSSRPMQILGIWEEPQSKLFKFHILI